MDIGTGILWIMGISAAVYVVVIFGTIGIVTLKSFMDRGN